MDLTEKQSDNQARHPWEVSRLKILIDIFKKNAGYKKNDTFTVLDIGCGDTYIADAFLDLYPGVKYYAVDTAFSQEHIDDYNSRFKDRGKDIYLYKDLKDIDSSVSADVVFLFDVIEHIEDDLGFMKQLCGESLLSHSVLCFISVPAFNSLFSTHDTFLKHYRRYNSSELQSVVEKSGFKKVKQGFFFSFLLIPRFFKVLREKRNNDTVKEYGVGVWKSQMLIDKCIVAFFMSEYYVVSFMKMLGIKIPGLSNYIVCKKSV